MSIEKFYDKHEPLRRQLELAGICIDAGRMLLDTLGVDTSPFAQLLNGHEARIRRMVLPGEKMAYNLQIKVAEGKRVGVGRTYAQVRDGVNEPGIMYVDASGNIVAPTFFDEAEDTEVAGAFETIKNSLLPVAAEVTAG